MNKTKAIVSVPSNFRSLGSYPILIHFIDSNQELVNNKRKEIFPRLFWYRKRYKTFHLNTDEVYEIDKRLNWETTTPGTYYSGTRILIRNEVNPIKLVSLLYPEEFKNMITEFSLMKLKIPVFPEEKKTTSLLHYLKLPSFRRTKAA